METIVVPETEELTLREGRDMLASRVSDRLGVSLEEFLARVDRGDYDDTDDRDVLYLMTLVPFAR